MLSKIYLLLALVFLMPLDLFMQQATKSQNTIASLNKKTGEPTDSTITFEYLVSEPAFIELKVFSYNGELFRLPVFAFKQEGNYTVTMNKSDFPEGTYVVDLRINHENKPTRPTLFRHFKKGNTVTFSDKENQLINRIQLYSENDPEAAYRNFDTLLTKYPSYINRGAAFLSALKTYMKVADSLHVVSLVDSIEHRLPYSSAFHGIATSSLAAKKYLDIGITYAQKAIKSFGDIPLPYQNNYLFNYLYTLSNLYLIKGEDNFALKTFLDAITVFNSLSATDRFYRGHSDVTIYNSLGLISEKRNDYKNALFYYQKALRRNPESKDLWISFQRAFTILNNSDSSYNVFKTEFAKTIPKEESNSSPKLSNVGKLFPEFSMSTLEGIKIESSDIKGKIAVINYWAYWCGMCENERPVLESLYQEFRNANFTTLGIHTYIGLVDSKKNEGEIVKKSLSKSLVSYHNLIQLPENKNMNAFIQIEGVPTTFVVDKKGVIRHEEIGFDKNRTYERLRKVINELLVE